MRRLELANYTNRLRNEQAELEDVEYDVKDSVAELLLSRALGLTGTDLLRNDELAHKIVDCKDGQFLLEDTEWERLANAVNTVQGLGRPDVELVRRILKAPVVEVEEKKGQKEEEK